MKPLLKNDIYIVDGLKLSDFQCKGAGQPQCSCGGAVMVMPRFMDFLIAFIRREKLSIKVDLAYCCKTWADHIGEPVDSKHRTGEAVKWNVIDSGLTETEAGQLAADSQYFTRLVLYGKSTKNGGGVITPVPGHEGKSGIVQLEYSYDEDTRSVDEKGRGERQVPLNSADGDSKDLKLKPKVAEISTEVTRR